MMLHPKMRLRSYEVQFENSENCDGNKILSCIHTILKKIEDGRKFDSTKLVAVLQRI